jgi:hypothetical protein
MRMNHPLLEIKMALAKENSRFNRDYLEAELARLRALLATLELRVHTLLGAGLDALAEQQQLAQTNEQIARIDAQLESLKP